MPEIFAGTLRHNIAYGWPEAPEADVERAAMDAHALDFVARLPSGLHTAVGHEQTGLSGGQVCAPPRYTAPSALPI